jgi:hypothetical protein
MAAIGRIRGRHQACRPVAPLALGNSTATGGTGGNTSNVCNAQSVTDTTPPDNVTHTELREVEERKVEDCITSRRVQKQENSR